MTADEQKHDQPFPLTMAGENEQVKIVLFRGSKTVEKRLTSLGLNVGGELRIVQREGGNLVVIRGETRLALGSGMAQKIFVTRRN